MAMKNPRDKVERINFRLEQLSDKVNSSFMSG